MDDIEYKLDAVKATRVPADDIEKTLRSGCLGSWFTVHSLSLEMKAKFCAGLTLPQ